MNLNQITVPSIDITRSKHFYQKLGLLLIVDTDHYLRFECPDGDSTFSVHLVDALPTGNGISVYFECTDLDQKYLDLKNKGILFSHPPQDESWLWKEARLNDPDGNKVILYYAGINRKNPPWRIKTKK